MSEDDGGTVRVAVRVRPFNERYDYVQTEFPARLCPHGQIQSSSNVQVQIKFQLGCVHTDTCRNSSRISAQLSDTAITEMGAFVFAFLCHVRFDPLVSLFDMLQRKINELESHHRDGGQPDVDYKSRQ